MLDHVMDAGCQLYPDEFKRAVKRLANLENPPISAQPTLGRMLPDALGRVDDGLHDAVSDELPVLVRNVVDWCLCA